MGFASTHFETHHSFHLHMGNMHSFIIIKKLLRLDEYLASCVHILHSLASHFVIISSLLAPVCKTPFTALIGLKMAIICNIDSFQFLSIKIVPIPIGFRAHIAHRKFDNGGRRSRNKGLQLVDLIFTSLHIPWTLNMCSIFYICKL